MNSYKLLHFNKLFSKGSVKQYGLILLFIYIRLKIIIMFIISIKNSYLKNI
jgi:hypothetical protein